MQFIAYHRHLKLLVVVLGRAKKTIWEEALMG
jgi:hypothetical protein